MNSELQITREEQPKCFCWSADETEEMIVHLINIL